MKISAQPSALIVEKCSLPVLRQLSWPGRRTLEVEMDTHRVLAVGMWANFQVKQSRRLRQWCISLSHCLCLCRSGPYRKKRRVPNGSFSNLKVRTLVLRWKTAHALVRLPGIFLKGKLAFVPKTRTMSLQVPQNHHLRKPRFGSTRTPICGLGSRPGRQSKALEIQSLMQFHRTVVEGNVHNLSLP